MSADGTSIGRITSEAEWELQLHRTAVNHLDRCRQAYWDWEEGEKDPADIDDPSFAPYDDCEDCTVREVLMVSWPMIEEHLGADNERLRRELAAVTAAYAAATNGTTVEHGAASGTAPEES